MGIAASAQSSYSPASIPATAPPSPADMIRQSSTLQGAGGQAYNDQNLAMQTEGGTLPLSPGDLINIQVFATPELSGTSRVDDQGDITLAVGGKVHVAGLNPTQTALAIQNHLKDAQIMIDPHVRVMTVQLAVPGITVLGEVARPGIYQLLGPHTLWDAISVASGFTTNAGKNITIAHRSDPSHPQTVPLNSLDYSATLDTTPVLPGDSIVVSRVDNFYVVGDVGRTGEFPLINGRPNTVLNALALCGGTNSTAKLSRASIVRTTTSGVQTIPINLHRILKNQATNPVLQASDVLVIPRSGGQAFLNNFLPNASLAVTSAVATALLLRY